MPAVRSQRGESRDPCRAFKRPVSGTALVSDRRFNSNGHVKLPRDHFHLVAELHLSAGSMPLYRAPQKLMGGLQSWDLYSRRARIFSRHPRENSRY
jgi:hypothetical protein